MKTLDEIESRLCALVEIQLVKFIPGYKQQDKVSRLLSAALFDGLVARGNTVKAPNFFTISGHPGTLVEWNDHPQILQELANALFQAGSEAGFRFAGRVKVVTVSDANLPPGEVRVLSAIRTSSLGETRSMKTIGAQGVKEDAGNHPNAFLIMGGSKIIPLEEPVLNIGRRLDNHIVIDDPRVSRAHAQLRSVRERFVLFDLQSTGGTYVNGKRINQVVLQPGDVITLAGTTLIFSQDIPEKHAPGDQTEPGSAVSAESPTVRPDQEEKPG